MWMQIQSLLLVFVAFSKRKWFRDQRMCFARYHYPTWCFLIFTWRQHASAFLFKLGLKEVWKSKFII